ncbi:cation:proton antiporter [Bacillus sp. AFS053548]|uniref:cation:proton antiporter n=1 Tax=Bacillus sp. AFS053548 TaxID=2033505 RepID=UPI0025712B0A|nr:cation:proton antiporter [Bacillus sp. AFS053548]
MILLASKIAGDISVRLKQPSVLGKLLIGIVLGPSVLGLVDDTDVLNEISQIGVILLMFIAGLETDIEEFKRTGKASTFVGIGGIIVPFLIGYLVGMFINLSPIQSSFFGLLLSATSVSISVQVLKEMNKLKTREGATVLGAAVIDDILFIIALAFLLSIAGSDGDVSLLKLILKKVLFFVGWKVVPYFLKKFSTLRVTETVISSALIICFIYAYIAGYTGVAAIIGAYIAGVSISVTEFKHEVFEKIETISYSLFVPVFFTSIGVSARFTGIVTDLGLIIMLSILAILTKLLGSSLRAKLSGFTWRNSLGIGSAMVSRGEVALIIASIGLENQLLDQSFFAVVLVVVLITTLVTPPMMKWFF